MIARLAPRQCRVELVARKAARWEARAWGHYLDYLALSDTPLDELTFTESVRLDAALDDCEYCCRRLDRLTDSRVGCDSPLTPGVHALPAGYVYDPPQLPSGLSAFDRGPHGPRREFGATTRSRRGSSAVVLTGLTAIAALGVWRLVLQYARGG